MIFALAKIDSYLSSEHPWKLRAKADVPRVVQAICSKDAFLFVLFFFNKEKDKEKTRSNEMDSWVIAMMLGASLFLGAIALAAFLWGIKNGQFDDEKRMMNQVQYDDEAELNDAANQQRKKESLNKEVYKPE